jgi:hypothetical protein
MLEVYEASAWSLSLQDGASLTLHGGASYASGHVSAAKMFLSCECRLAWRSVHFFTAISEDFCMTLGQQ